VGIEFVTSEGYTGFTKAGVRIRADKFEDFKSMINSIDPKDLATKTPEKAREEPKETDNDDSGIDEQGLM